MTEDKSKTKDIAVSDNTRANSSTTLRRRREFELRVAGLSVKDIYEEMVKNYEDLPLAYSTNTITTDIERELQDVKNEVKDYAFYVLEFDLLRLENLLMVYYNKAITGDEKSANITLRIMERRARMLGLDTPRKIEVHSWRSEIIELWKSGKLTREQIEKELGNELARQVFEPGVNEFTPSGEAEIIREDIIEG
jgi:hypothetical protein